MDSIKVRRIILVTVLMSAIGAVIGVGLFPASDNRVVLIIAAFGGAAVGGTCSAWAFGSRGRKGWAKAFLGGLMATAIGAAVGGFFVFPQFEVLLLAPVFVASGLLEAPHLGLIWLALMGLAQLAVLWFMPRSSSWPKPRQI